MTYSTVLPLPHPFPQAGPECSHTRRRAPHSVRQRANHTHWPTSHAPAPTTRSRSWSKGLDYTSFTPGHMHSPEGHCSTASTSSPRTSQRSPAGSASSPYPRGRCRRSARRQPATFTSVEARASHQLRRRSPPDSCQLLPTSPLVRPP